MTDTKKLTLIASLLLLLPIFGLITPATAQHEEWNKTFGWIGDESGEYAYPLPNGFLLAGKECCGVWLIRTDLKGNMIDSKYFKGANVILKTSEGNAVAGLSGKIWLIETDNFGKRRWGAFIKENFTPWIKQSKDGYFVYGVKSLDEAKDLIKIVKIKVEKGTELKGIEFWNLSIVADVLSIPFLLPTSDGGCLLLINIKRNNGDVSAVKIDSSGKVEWNVTLGGEGYDRFEQWYNHYNPAIETSDGFIIAATTESDVWLIKLDKSGKEVWNRTYGGDGFEKAISIVNASDGYVIAGVTDSYGYGNCGKNCNGNKSRNLNIWLLKVDKKGNEVWNSTFGGEGVEGVSCLKRIKDGYLISGWTNSFRDVKIEAKAKERPRYPYWTAGWLIKVDAKGKEVWNLTFGGLGKDLIGCAEVLEVNNSTGYIIAGTTSDGSGMHDAWLIKVNDSKHSDLDKRLENLKKILKGKNLTDEEIEKIINSIKNLSRELSEKQINEIIKSYEEGEYVYSELSQEEQEELRKLPMRYRHPPGYTKDFSLESIFLYVGVALVASGLIVALYFAKRR